MCQWWSTIFHWSISLASWWTRLVSNCINWFTLPSLGCLATSYTFCYHLAFLHGCNRPSYCISGDKTTTSRCWIPSYIEVHLFGFWNYCYWATLRNNRCTPRIKIGHKLTMNSQKGEMIIAKSSYTFCYHLAFLHGCNRPSYCISGDKTTTSRCWIPSHIEVHLFGFWNYCYWATLRNNRCTPRIRIGHKLTMNSQKGVMIIAKSYSSRWFSSQ